MVNIDRKALRKHISDDCEIVVEVERIKKSYHLADAVISVYLHTHKHELSTTMKKLGYIRSWSSGREETSTFSTKLKAKSGDKKLLVMAAHGIDYYSSYIEIELGMQVCMHLANKYVDSVEIKGMIVFEEDIVPAEQECQ